MNPRVDRITYVPAQKLFPVPTKLDMQLPFFTQMEENSMFSSTLPSSCEKNSRKLVLYQKMFLSEGKQIIMLKSSTNGGSDSWVTKAWISRCNLSKKDGEMDRKSTAERRENSFDFLTAQTTKMFFGKQRFPSLIRWMMSLNMAKKGDIPMPPATRIRFSYLNKSEEWMHGWEIRHKKQH